MTELGKDGTGLVPTDFCKARNKIQGPAKLSRIEKETWIDPTLDGKTKIYEGLPERIEEDMRKYRSNL